jgi:hypothetical protein
MLNDCGSLAAGLNQLSMRSALQCSKWIWLAIKSDRCETEARIPLDAVRRPRDTPIWKLEAALKCRSCKKGRYAPPVHMIKLTETRQTTPYRWVHPDDDR